MDTKARFASFFEKKGRTVLEREQNDVEYLRVEGDQLAELVQEFRRLEFGVSLEERMDLVASGFRWV